MTSRSRRSAAQPIFGSSIILIPRAESTLRVGAMAVHHWYACSYWCRRPIHAPPFTVLSPSNPVLVQRATDVITYIARRFAGTPLELTPLIASALRALGAKEDSLVFMGVQAAEVPYQKLSVSNREMYLTRLVSIAKAFIEYVACLHP